MLNSTSLSLPPGPFDAFLFDLDGTVADSMPLHFRAWSTVFAEQGASFPEPYFYALGGVPLLRVVEIVNEQQNLHMDPAHVVARKEQLYLDLLPELTPVAAVVEVLQAYQGKLPFAIVSGSPRDSIRRTLATLHLTEYFPTIVGMEDYTLGKPNPEPFLRAATLLNVTPARCLVFEDAEAGFASAAAAGMQCVRIPQPAMLALAGSQAAGQTR